MMKEIAIIGFGNQAKAWCLNLKDSGWNVSVGLRESSQSIAQVKKLGFEFFDFTQENNHTKFAVLTPDDTHYEVVKSIYKYNKEANFIYAHGFSLMYSPIAQEFNSASHLLLAPKAIASELRFQYETGGKSGALYSLEVSKSEDIKSWFFELASDLGIKSFHQASISDETKADLFSEQSLLCSVIPYAALYSFKQLTDAGISQEAAYFECWHEVKLIADSLIKFGPDKFFELISPNALVGSEIGRSAIFTDQYFIALNNIYNHINSGEFEKQLMNVDKEKLRQDVLTFWQKESLTSVHKKMKQELY